MSEITRLIEDKKPPSLLDQKTIVVGLLATAIITVLQNNFHIFDLMRQGLFFVANILPTQLP